MATGKARGGKRSSGSSYSSTLTTIIFVTLCVLGVWMLNSSSVSLPKATTRTSTTTTTDQSSSTNIDSQQPKPTYGKTSPVFEDSQGDLPDDAIKSDEPTKTEEANGGDQKPEDEQKDTQGGSVGKVEEGESSQNDKQETGQENDDGKTEANGADNKDKGDVKDEEKNTAKEIQQGKEESVVEQEKQKALETQLSEESSLTQRLEVEEAKAKQVASTTKGSKAKEIGQELNKDGQDGSGKQETAKVDNNANPQDLQNVISDEDQMKRIEEHQKQEEDQIKQETDKGTQGVTSDDQIQHDEAKPSSAETDQTNQETKDAMNTKIHNAGGQKPSANNKDEKKSPGGTNLDSASKASNEVSLPGETAGIPKESKESKRSWATQADQSDNQKERRSGGITDKGNSFYGYTWQLCNVTAGQDYIPCLDNEKAIAKLRSRSHYEHRERHCPEDPPICVVPLPKGYKKPIEWPQSRDKIWYHNVPHTSLAQVKGHQNWVKMTGEFLTFPGGGTQFIHGAAHYLDFLQEAVPDIAWGKHTRVVLDVGCGVASFGGYLFDRDVLTMSFAPKDEHEAQVQFALERGIPAISAVMGTQRLPFPSRVFDLVHCARCRVPWHADGGALLLELNRVLRPGGYFVWSATPVYQTLEEDVQIWKEMSALTVAMCWELVTIKKDKLNSIGAAFYHKPETNDCYEQRKQNQPPMCKTDDDPNAAWYIPLQSCLHRIPVEENERGSEWPNEWPKRTETAPYWLNRTQMGIYGKPSPDDFLADYEHWKRVVSKTYMSGLGISWKNVRNVMDMRAVYGGFAAALKDLNVWVLNVVTIDSPDTLPIIYERGLFGIYHDWCESFSSYPRTYDLLHADHLLSKLRKRCKLLAVMAEIDRLVRPGGKLIVRDQSSTIGEVENILKSLHWEVHLTFSKNQEGILSAQKSFWRPDTYITPS